MPIFTTMIVRATAVSARSPGVRPKYDIVSITVAIRRISEMTPSQSP